MQIRQNLHAFNISTGQEQDVLITISVNRDTTFGELPELFARAAENRGFGIDPEAIMVFVGSNIKDHPEKLQSAGGGVPKRAPSEEKVIDYFGGDPESAQWSVTSSSFFRVINTPISKPNPAEREHYRKNYAEFPRGSEVTKATNIPRDPVNLIGEFETDIHDREIVGHRNRIRTERQALKAKQAEKKSHSDTSKVHKTPGPGRRA